jgi:hypothetical protein
MLSRGVTAVAAAILLAVSGGSAVAQSRADTLRDALLGGRRKPPPVARYVAGDDAFILDRTGDTPLLKFETTRRFGRSTRPLRRGATSSIATTWAAPWCGPIAWAT